MDSTQRDLSILKKFDFQRQPVGVKYLLKKPEGIKRLDKTLALCEMLPEAQKGEAFYAGPEDLECARMPMGMVDTEPIVASGQLGPRLGVFKEARANRNIFQVLPKLEKNTVNYVAFSPLDKLTYDPDVLIITASPSQTEIILRASSYTTGKMFVSKMTPVIGCAWLYVYPYLSGELNYTVTGLCFGMKARQVFPEGLVLIAIPYHMLPMVIDNLQDMEWVLPAYTIGRDGYSQYFGKLIAELNKEYGSPTK